MTDETTTCIQCGEAIEEGQAAYNVTDDEGQPAKIHLDCLAEYNAAKKATDEGAEEEDEPEEADESEDEGDEEEDDEGDESED